MVVTIFKHRMKPGVDKEYGADATKLLAIAQKMPGFVSIKGYAAADGEQLILVEFENEQALAAWREHPEHLIAQELGRTKYYSEYQIQICNTVREYGFKSPTS
ncbi:MAG TPA: antibiotic biosynthesis monooxygenase [Candidatus Acidoferrales bacterium]|nr:antibiotic biosynthesis monooxygenase [Candidatus Acidoferrales bacterium]